jgi:hypothetical protein
MKKDELPPRFDDRPFLVSEARAEVGDARLRGQDLQRPYRGVRVSANAPAHPIAIVERCRAYLPLLLPGHFFSHATAGLLWRLPLPASLDNSYAIASGSGAVPFPLHVSSTTPSRPRRVGIVGHRAEPGHPVVMRYGLPTSDAPSTWLALAPLLSLDQLIMTGDALVQVDVQVNPQDPRPFTTVDDLTRAVEGWSGRGVRLASQALREVRVGSESPRETLLRLLLVRAGLPEPELNVDVTDHAGKRLGRGDLVWPRWRTVTEYDGEQHRTDATQYARDERRIEEFMRAGWQVVRVRKGGLTAAGRAETVERVKRALRSAGWRG